MVTTVDAGFRTLLGALTTTAVETSAAAAHRASIHSKLSAQFGITSFFRTGSFGSGTNVSGYSDVDYFAVVPDQLIKVDSAIMLGDFAVALRERFPTTTGIRVDAPGVAVPFGLDGAGKTEIVPVKATGFTLLGYRQFNMPDGTGGWMFSAPESHNAYVADIDAKHGGTVKLLIRLLKAWKFARNVPLKSFYLEMFAARFADGETSIIFDMDLRTLFRKLVETSAQPILDPRFPGDNRYLFGTNTDAQRADALAKATMAYEWAEAAVAYGQAGRINDAISRWELVFNYAYPAYG